MQVPLEREFIDEILRNYRFDVHHHVETGAGGAELAELGTWVSDMCDLLFKFGTDTEVWIKPMQLYNWLNWAIIEKYTHVRLVFHGSCDEGYDAMRNHASA